MILPTALDPVKLITGTSLCFESGAPASGPSPLTIFTTPFGNPASISACTSDTTKAAYPLPASAPRYFQHTSAGIIFHDGIAIGKFHGVIIPHTPIDCRTLIANLFGNSEGVVCPNSRRPSPAM